MVKVLLWVLGSILGILALSVIGVLACYMSAQSKLKNLPVEDLDFASLMDSTYAGEYNGWRWSNTVQATVASGRVTDIQVVKDMDMKPPEFSQGIANSVVRSQSPKVDAVTGATTKAYLKYLEDALGKAR